MATLLAIIRPGGRTQRCDARCYDARKGSDCDCVCSGVNHAAGRDVAMILTRQQVQAWIAAAREADPDIDHIEIGLEAQAIPLF
ncbi:hypothetical protein ABT352_33505 [Streptosporangium sp. NPDC000563]|uniref:hypothetical protein n=1 Tax=Streptosporangium sp. NPDC000563 TaxID=3154366 RepID=UPI00331FD2DB